MGNPFFLSKNYVSALDTINVSSRDATKICLYDQKAALQWTSYGETTETGYDTYIEVVFYEGLVAATRVFDTLVLQNINVKKFKFQYWDGAAYQDITGGEVTTNAAATVRIKLAATVTTTKIKLLMQSTIVAGQEKKIGELWVMLQTFELTEGRHSHSRSDYKEGGAYYLASGKMETFTVFKKYAAKIDFELLTLVSIVLFKALYDLDSNFTIYLNYGTDADGIYNVCWTNTFTYDEDTLRGYFKLSMEIKEQ